MLHACNSTDEQKETYRQHGHRHTITQNNRGGEGHLHEITFLYSFLVIFWNRYHLNFLNVTKLECSGASSLDAC